MFIKLVTVGGECFYPKRESITGIKSSAHGSSVFIGAVEITVIETPKEIMTLLDLHTSED